MAAAMLGGVVGAWLAALVLRPAFRVALPVVLAACGPTPVAQRHTGHTHAPH